MDYGFIVHTASEKNEFRSGQGQTVLMLQAQLVILFQKDAVDSGLIPVRSVGRIGVITAVRSPDDINEQMGSAHTPVVRGNGNAGLGRCVVCHPANQVPSFFKWVFPPGFRIQQRTDSVIGEGSYLRLGIHAGRR